jgi:hypothetical protein
MSPATPDLPRTEIAIVELTNAFRKEMKLGEVRPSPELARAARTYAEFLARTGLFSHSADGRQPADRVKAAGYAYCLVAENLAMNLDSHGFDTRRLAKTAVEGWKDSPGHRKNMLAEHATEIGVAIAKGKGEERYFSVQLFARPQALKYTFKVTNGSALPVRYSYGGETLDIGPRMIMTHTACTPGELVFERAGAKGDGRTLSGRYRTRDGDHFLLRLDRDGQMHIDHQPGPLR